MRLFTDLTTERHVSSLPILGLDYQPERDDIENWLEVFESYSDPRDGMKAVAGLVGERALLHLADSINQSILGSDGEVK